jgi:hypothetical protein
MNFGSIAAAPVLTPPPITRITLSVDVYHPCLLSLHVGAVAVHDADTICEPAVPDGVSATYAVFAVVIAENPVTDSSEENRKNAPAISTDDPAAIADTAEPV